MTEDEKTSQLSDSQKIDTSLLAHLEKEIEQVYPNSAPVITVNKVSEIPVENIQENVVKGNSKSICLPYESYVVKQHHNRRRLIDYNTKIQKSPTENRHPNRSKIPSEPQIKPPGRKNSKGYDNMIREICERTSQYNRKSRQGSKFYFFNL